jgi:hypothetical protein
VAGEPSSYKHDASDRKLDQSAEASNDGGGTADTQHSSGVHHDPEKIRRHDDDGKDRLFEDRQQHDEAEKNSEKTRLARDVERHDHDVDDDVADSGAGAGAKRKS